MSKEILLVAEAVSNEKGVSKEIIFRHPSNVPGGSNFLILVG